MSTQATDLQSRLETWTRCAVKLATRASIVGSTCPGVSIAEYMSNLSSALCTRLVNRHCLLANLPRTVLSGICSRMTLWDTMQLALTSRGIRAIVLAIPEVWSTLALPSQEQSWVPVVISPPELASFLACSVPAVLDLRLHIVTDRLPEQASIIATHLHRMTRLRVTLFSYTANDGPNCWDPLFQEGLSEPAPLLTTLELSYIVTFTSIDQVNPAFFSRCYSLETTLFSGYAPRLATCRLVQISLPPRALCGAFRNVTNFSYNLHGTMESSKLADILATMPHLESLQLSGIFFASNDDPQPDEIPPAPRLRNLMLSFADMDLAAVHRMVPLRQLRELRIETSSIDPFIAAAEAHADIDSLCLLVRDGRLDGCMTSRANSATTDITFNWTGAHNTRLADFLAPFPNLTSLEIHEFLWDHDVFGPPPALPNLAILCMHLARRTDYSSYWPSEGRLVWWYTWESLGIIGGRVWALPALREVHVTAAWGADVDAEVRAVCESNCLPKGGRGTAMSVALRDVARWVRDGIAFETAKLDVIGISGVRAIDSDFSAAWEELTALSKSVEMTETPGRPFCLVTGSRGYHEHFLTTIWESNRY